KLLESGKYRVSGNREIEALDTAEPIKSANITVENLSNDKRLENQITAVDVSDEQIALHFLNGRFDRALRRGKHAFWTSAGEHEFKFCDISSPDIKEAVPEYVFSKMPSTLVTKLNVPQGFKALVYFGNKLQKTVDEGTYYFWKNGTEVSFKLVDTRLLQLNITGQEILTLDKVALRINFFCDYRITDPVKIISEIDDFKEHIYIACQLALREYVGKYKLDEILESKDKLAQFVFEKLKEKESELFVRFTDAGIKDIILPGEIRSIMNTVLIAEKKAQANVITRREEVASTRSLLNTARLMDENKTLYKLKQLEFVERICENVGNIELSSRSDLLSQLTDILQMKEA
ncbi:MAG: slipin family protein, partial [Acutalibacteraceae bacterium]